MKRNELLPDVQSSGTNHFGSAFKQNDLTHNCVELLQTGVAGAQTACALASNAFSMKLDLLLCEYNGLITMTT